MSHHSHIPPELDDAVRMFIRKHKRGVRWGCLVSGLLATALFLAAAWGLLRGAFHIKDWVMGKVPAIRMPLEWEKPMGDAALAQLRSQTRFITDQQVLDPLNRLATPLFSALTNSTDRFTLFVIDSKEVNAFALPGGYIVFHRGLLERARTAEEIQGVMAHEIAHIQKRHGVLQLAQNIGLDLALQQIQGGENRLLDTLLRDSGQLLGLKFSRDHERAADDRGWELLEQAQINPQGMLNFFAGLQADMNTSTGTIIPLLSTHPAPKERLDRLRQKSTISGQQEYRSFTEEFNALRNGLGVTLERP